MWLRVANRNSIHQHLSSSYSSSSSCCCLLISFHFSFLPLLLVFLIVVVAAVGCEIDHRFGFDCFLGSVATITSLFFLKRCSEMTRKILRGCFRSSSGVGGGGPYQLHSCPMQPDSHRTRLINVRFSVEIMLMRRRTRKRRKKRRKRRRRVVQHGLWHALSVLGFCWFDFIVVIVVDVLVGYWRDTLMAIKLIVSS